MNTKEAELVVRSCDPTFFFARQMFIEHRLARFLLGPPGSSPALLLLPSRPDPEPGWSPAVPGRRSLRFGRAEHVIDEHPPPHLDVTRTSSRIDLARGARRGFSARDSPAPVGWSSSKDAARPGAFARARSAPCRLRGGLRARSPDAAGLGKVPPAQRAGSPTSGALPAPLTHPLPHPAAHPTAPRSSRRA
jgi:hypothetical protein